jgi:succinylarginine dihydrolase
MRKVMTGIFDGEKFQIHDALPAAYALSDEGAANHTRLCKSHGEPGLHLFVYGFDPFDRSKSMPQKYPARQSSLASESIARRHRVNDYLLIQQTPRAIDAGVFHNDVISVGNENVLLMHEFSFVDQQRVVESIQDFFRDKDCEFFPVVFGEAELPIEDAVGSYFFNSQIVTRPDGKMSLICPQEVSETESAARCAESLVAGPSPIDEVKYFDLRQSMNNGGGPACLRLLVAVTEPEFDSINTAFQLTESRAEQIGNWISSHYRETLTKADLADANLAAESSNAMQELAKLLRC